tara:strand:+ start:477 stop:1346 length:870 start_codon:yes stop_codon:yes gene_type:complete
MQKKNLKNLKNITNKKILITGSTGFLGFQILKSLLKKNHKIFIVVRKNSKNIFKLKNLDKRRIKIFYCEDIFDSKKKFLDNITKNIDIVIHCAWNVEGNFMNSDEHLKCLIGTLNLAESCIKNNIKKFVGIGSCVEYDPTDGYLSVKTKLNPSTNYSAAKIAAFTALSRLFKFKGINFLWCRVFYLYGEGENKNRLIPYLKRMLKENRTVELTSGKQIRDYIDVKKAGNEISRYAIVSKNGEINICSGKGVSIKNMVSAIARKVNKSHLLKFGARKENPFDPPKVIGVK